MMIFKIILLKIINKKILINSSYLITWIGVNYLHSFSQIIIIMKYWINIINKLIKIYRSWKKILIRKTRASKKFNWNQCKSEKKSRSRRIQLKWEINRIFQLMDHDQPLNNLAIINSLLLIFLKMIKIPKTEEPTIFL